MAMQPRAIRAPLSLAEILMSVALLALTAGAQAAQPAQRLSAESAKSHTYDQDTVIQNASEFFGKGSAGIAKVIAKAFKDQGRPDAIIKGEEVGGALVAGLRYGDGTLTMKNGAREKIFWTGPSVGFDIGANVSKVYVLVYHLPDPNAIFRRFPAVDGSLYYIAGASINYQRVDGIVLAPIRLGVGLRAGVNLGYVHYTRKKTWLPF